jgi:hypothetical protein
MKHIYCILISSLTFISSYAQPKDAELSHYLFPEFTQGVTLMKNGIKTDALLNYNSLTEEMIFENKGKKLAVSLAEIGLVDTIFIKDRKFIGLNTVFVELLYHSTWDLYGEHKCKVETAGKPSGYGGTSKTAAISTPASLNSGSGYYDLKLPEDYIVKPYSYYWLKKNGEINKFETMRELKKLYKDQEDLFKAYVKEHHVKYDNQEGIIQLVEHLESQ